MKRGVLVAVLAAALGAVAAIGHSIWRTSEADDLLAEARKRLDAPLLDAPELDRIQASTALSQIERAQALGRNDVATRALRHRAEALVHLQRGDLIFAEGELSTARHLEGWTAPLHVLAGAIARARTDLEGAAEHARRALTLDPESTRALLLDADVALDRGDAVRARASLESLVAKETNVASLHNRLGLALEAWGDLEAAERAFAKAIDLDERSADGWVNLARARRARGDLDGASAAFSRAAHIAPGSPDAWLGLGLAATERGALDEAEPALRRAAELSPNDAEPLLAVGDVRRLAGDVQGAIALYRDAIAREDADAASWLKLGNALVLAGQPRAGILAYGEAIRRAPALAAAYNGLGAALMNAGDHAEAADALARAAELDSRDPNPLLNLALLRERTGDPRGARAAWEEAQQRTN